MQPCEDRIPSLVDAASGDLSTTERAALSEHLLQCAACRSEMAALEQTTSLLTETSRMPEDFSISGFAARTADRAESFRDGSARGLWWSVTRGMRIAASLSGGALVTAAAFFVMAQDSSGPTIAPTPVVATANEVPEPWEAYIPEAVRLMHSTDMSNAGLFAEEPPSLEDGLNSLSDEELETLALAFSRG